MTRTMIAAVSMLALAAGAATLVAQSPPAVISGPVGPSPYDIVRGWHKPFAEPGFAFGGNSGVFAESPNRIFVAQHGEFRLPNPVPAGFAGFYARSESRSLVGRPFQGRHADLKGPRCERQPFHGSRRTSQFTD